MGKSKHTPPPRKPRGEEAEKAVRLITENRQARHQYHIDEQVEAGLVLTGTEVKACRQGKAQLKDAYGVEHKGEFFLHGAHISHYSHGNIHNHEPERLRKLLLHKSEIARLFGKVREKGYTFVPLKLYFKGARVKVLMGLAKGKKMHDKRDTIKERDTKREMERAFANHRRQK